MRRLDPLLEEVIAAGLMTRAEAEAVDAFAEEILQAQACGEMSDDEAHRAIVDRATADAIAKLRKEGN
jgi:hypothetical protein